MLRKIARAALTTQLYLIPVIRFSLLSFSPKTPPIHTQSLSTITNILSSLTSSNDIRRSYFPPSLRGILAGVTVSLVKKIRGAGGGQPSASCYSNVIALRSEENAGELKISFRFKINRRRGKNKISRHPDMILTFCQLKNRKVIKLIMKQNHKPR